MSRINDREVHMQENSVLNVARSVSSGDIFGNDRDLDKLAEQDKKSKLNQAIHDKQESLSKHEELLKQYHDEMVSDLNDCEIMPVFSNILIKPYSTNPFQKIEKVGNLIVDTGGYTPEYKSNETGEWEEMEQDIQVANVIEVGPECKYVKPGDAVFYRKISAIPIPFYKLGFYTINEHSVFQIVNVGLTKRLKG